MWEHFLLLLGQRVRPAGSPKAHEVIYELTACQSILLRRSSTTPLRSCSISLSLSLIILSLNDFNAKLQKNIKIEAFL
jgi:hypothetical protein